MKNLGDFIDEKYKLKQVSQKELIIGNYYCDSARIHSLDAVVMKYLGKNKGHYEFMYIFGLTEYINNGDGIIQIKHYKKEPNWYWLCTNDLTLNSHRELK